MKHTRIRRLAALCLVLCLLLPVLFSCTPLAPTAYTFEFYEYFDTFSSLTVYAHNAKEADRYAALAEELLGDWHRLLDRHRAYEGTANLHTLNERAGTETVTADPRLLDFLTFAKEMHTMTAGKTNLCLGAVLSLWQTEREAANENPAEARLPDQAKLAEAATHTDANDLLIDPAAGTVRFADPAMSLDAGALGKGYAAEQCKKALLEAGCTSFLINLGGNTLGVGQKPKNQSWRCAIENPTEGGGFDGAIRLTDMSLVTTGSYHRYYTVDGKTYGHVIDPDTLMPPDLFLSVSILTEDSGVADALSTALFCMTYEEGLALVASLPNTEALWILPDGTTRQSEGLSAYIQSI